MSPVSVNSGRFSWGEHQLAYELYGDESGTPCVLVHGLLVDSLVNRDLAYRFAAAGYRVVLLDLLGHGLSDKPTDPREHRVEFHGEQVVALLDHLGIERALIGGMSLGAMATLQVAAKAPERCLGLFLEMPVMEWSTMFAAILLTPLILTVDFAKPLFRRFAHFMRKLPRPPYDPLASAMNAASAEPEVITAVLHGLLVGPVVPTARARRAMTMPALIIGHGGDKLHELSDAEGLARELPNARLLKARSIIELRWKPERLWPEIARFLDEVREQAALPAAAPAPKAALGSDLKQRFDAAAARVRSAPDNGPLKPSNEMKLRMYGLYRQATAGDAHGARPGMMDIVGRMKFDAWAGFKGLGAEEAMHRYVEEVEKIERKLAG
jgi:pimeloyl-ACP methyl ester carboxylesterase/acyl-CoA-binding protein